MKRQSALVSVLVAARNCQVLPPSADLKAPTPTRPALASPVPRYTMLVLDGSNAIVVTEGLGRKSKLARHEAPPSLEIQSPPEPVPARMRDGAPGSNAMARTRPPTFEGPSDCHLEGCN